MLMSIKMRKHEIALDDALFIFDEDEAVKLETLKRLLYIDDLFKRTQFLDKRPDTGTLAHSSAF